ncbi:MAG: hypothetical protein ACJ768_19630 [Gaiellaceae bacterium]
MARDRTRDPRFDFRGGVVTALSNELLDARELRRLENGRSVRGALEPRLGSKRIHDTALPGGAVLGVVQWDAPAGKQVVAIAADGLYHKLAAATDFTKVAGVWDPTKPVSFVAHRVGVTIVLYIANGVLRRWDGAAVTTIAGASVPAATWLALYLGRGFAVDSSKRLYASAIGDLTKWAAGESAVFADVETYDTEGLVALCKVGASLALAKEDNIARFSGVDPGDIRIDTQTRGISGDTGVAAPRTFLELEQSAFGLSDRGPFVTSDAQLDLSIGAAIADLFEDADPDELAAAVAVHHLTRREVWLWLGAEVWAWHYDTRTWSGPWLDMPATCACRYERADGTETVLRGDVDGFVREEDLGTRTDVHRDGTGGAAIYMRAELPTMVFGEPTLEKNLGQVWQELVAELPAGSTCAVEFSSEKCEGSVAIVGAGAKAQAYPFKLWRAKGNRFAFTLALSGAGARILAVVLEGAIGGRR